jgi:SAM-dependent methyltransferase
MDDREIERMAAMEGSHWWYRGLRDLIVRTLWGRGLQPPARPRILDAGCGTGATLRAIQEIFSPAYLGGFDLSQQAVRLTQSHVSGADIYPSDIRNPELRQHELDVILSCDVISIAGIPQSMEGMRQMTRRLRPGGALILNLPAIPWLNGPHDRSVGTCHRVTTSQVHRLIETLGLSAVWLTYRVFLPFPAIAATRILARFRGRAHQTQSDLRPCPLWLNRMLSRMLVAENRAILRGLAFPWGSSVYAVAEKR